MSNDPEGKKILVDPDARHRDAAPHLFAAVLRDGRRPRWRCRAMVWFTMDGTSQLKKGAAEKIKLDPKSDVDAEDDARAGDGGRGEARGLPAEHGAVRHGQG
jgi:hypothetical protein